MLVIIAPVAADSRRSMRSFGQRYVYEVRALREVRPDDLRALPHSEYDVLTLITCKDYDVSSGGYDWRLAFAVNRSPGG